jgi:uncharacterized membrane protein YwaF
VTHGGIALLRQGALWRAFGVLLAFAASVGLCNATFKTNYMYLCNKPKSATLLDVLAPWPVYLLLAFGLAFTLL